jgi:hypothetical protein
MRRVSCLVLFAALFAAAPAAAQQFSDAPIACGAGSHYKTCKASFDGWTLRIEHFYPDGKMVLATYRKCAANVFQILCEEGRWDGVAGGWGGLGGRSVGLKGGKPFAD